MKKFVLFLFALVMGLAVFCGIKTKATGITLEMEDGAQVRTEGLYQGLRFEAEVDTLEGSAAHGFYLAIGEHTLTAMRTAIEGGATLVEGDKLVNVPATGEDKKFAVTIYGIGSDYYLEDITAIAYVKVGDDYTLDVAVTRNIAEVALIALNENETGEILTNVATYISANYKKGYDTYDGRYAIDNAAYCYNPEQLGQLFVRDWNKFVDAEDRIASITSNTKATAASLTYKTYSGADFYYSAKWTKWSDSGTTSNKNISDSNLYRFFNDSVYGPKWGWLLTVMRTAEGDAANAAWQSIAVQGDGTNGTKTLYAGQHLCISIVGFFTEQKLTYGYTGVDFASSKKSMYNNLYTGSYANTTVYNSFLGEQDIFEIDEVVTLPFARTPETGYAWVAYELNSVNHAEGSSYTVTDGNVQFAPKFSLINYTVTYYDGDTPLDLSPSTYTVVTDTFSLPNYEKDSYVFDGWYDNELFEGSPYTEIARGSHENMTFYAKTTYTPYATVNVTFNLDGGNWALEDIISQNEPTKTIVATYYNSYQNDGLDISFVENPSQSTYWVYIVLAATDVENVYRITGKANGSANLPATYDAVISYHSSCESEYFNDVKAIYSGSNIGQYITVENKPNTSGGSKSITIKLFPSTVLTANHVKNMNEPASLPTPVKNGYEFAGWLNSISSNVDSSFPGYNPNPGDITYTAQWDAIDNMALSSNDSRALGLIGTPDIIVNADPTYSSGSFNVNGRGYTAGKDLFANISDAVAAVKGLRNTIYVFAGTYNGNFTISVSGISLIGPNDEISAVDGERSAEAIINGVITLGRKVNNTTINGFSFIDNSKVTSTPEGDKASTSYNNTGINFGYNKVVSSLSDGNGFLDFTESNRSYSRNIVINGCYFEQTTSGLNSIIYLQNNINITITNSKFNNIKNHVLSTWDTSSTRGGAGSIIIEGNSFTNITGSILWGDYVSGMSADTYSIKFNRNLVDRCDGGACFDIESSNPSIGYVTFEIKGNTFKDVYKAIWLYKCPTTATVQYNKFYLDDLNTGRNSYGYVCSSPSDGGQSITCIDNIYLSVDGSEVLTATTSGFNYGSHVTDKTYYTTLDAYNAAYATYIGAN